MPDASIPASPPRFNAAWVASVGQGYDTVPVWETYIDDCETPVSAYLKLRGDSPSFLLESGDRTGPRSRYSFIGVQPSSVLRWSLGDEGDPYEKLRESLAGARQAPVEGLPPFTGGAVGCFAYDLIRTVEDLGAPKPDPLGTPDLALMMSNFLVAFDHHQHAITILAQVSTAGDIDDNLAGARREIAKLRARLAQAIEPVQARAVAPSEFTSNLQRSEYEAMVERIVEYIYAGDAFQVVPSQRWTAPLDVDGFSVYRGVRIVNPSAYLYYFDFGDFQVAGASPEPLLRINGRDAMTYPIAGTRPRGVNDAEDARLAKELLANDKERAEHIMLVDLARNDLARVCEAGSVRVDKFMEIELFSHVMHIVSSVHGSLRDGVSPIDALRSVCPVGTLSGAPKIRAMEIIDELEPIKRCGYGGAVGYLSYTGDIDTAIHIRTVVIKDGLAHIQAGGGTVADATPEGEYQESVDKSRALKAAVALAVEQVAAGSGWQ